MVWRCEPSCSASSLGSRSRPLPAPTTPPRSTTRRTSRRSTSRSPTRRAPRSRPIPSEYVDATLALAADGIDYGPETVEVRLKGNASFRPLGQKAAFKVKFPKANRLLGLKSMTLNNMVQDPSMVHETLGYEILRAAGVAGPAHGLRLRARQRRRLRALPQPRDLRRHLDGAAVRRRFDTRHLYEADELGVDVVPGGAGLFEVEEGDEDDISDLEALIAAANASAGDWSDGMAATADLDAMTRMWAGESYLGHWDGYSVTAGPELAEQLLPAQRRGGRFTMLPSGSTRPSSSRLRSRSGTRC